MKKLLALILALCLVFTLCACGAKEEPAAPAEAPAAAPAEAAASDDPWADVEPIVIEYAHANGVYPRCGSAPIG